MSHHKKKKRKVLTVANLIAAIKKMDKKGYILKGKLRFVRRHG